VEDQPWFEELGKIPEITFDVLPKVSAKPCGKNCSLWRKSPIVKEYNLIGTSTYEAIFLCRSFLEVLNDYDTCIYEKFSLHQQLELYKISSLWGENFVQYAKYFTAFPMAKYLHNSLPVKPEGYPTNNWLVSGGLKRYLKARVHSVNKKNTHLMASFLQGIKRGCASVSPEYVLKSLEKHQETLSRPPREIYQLGWRWDSKNQTYHFDSKDWADIMDDSEREERMIRKFDIFYRSFKAIKPQLLEASTSASIESRRSSGGGREYLRETILRKNNDESRYSTQGAAHGMSNPPEFFEFLESKQPVYPVELISDIDFENNVIELLGNEFIDILRRDLGEIDKEEREYEQYKKDYAEALSGSGDYSPATDAKYLFEPSNWKKFDGDSVRYFDDDLLWMKELRPGHVVTLKGLAPPDWYEVIQSAQTKLVNQVMVSAVCEPLKVRLITKGNAVNYWISRFYQKSLWKHLQKFPQFCPTGRPLCVTDLYDLLDREKLCGLDDLVDFVSGDYSAATDNLNIKFTKAAFEASLKRAIKDNPDIAQLADILRSVLYEQEIHYPEKSDIEPTMQKNGQLMGSTLSFPILCIVNLVSYWQAMENVYGRKFRFEQLPVIINGDDILFRSNPKIYKEWLRNIAIVGFELSLGKNYVHPKILTINSQIFHFSSVERTFKEVHFLNVGLLTGQSKISGRTGVRTLPLWDFYNMSVPMAANPERAHKRFLYYHKNKIDEISEQGKYNLFVPRERGGIGFDPSIYLKLREPGTRVTKFQQQFGGYLWKDLCKRIDESLDPVQDTFSLTLEERLSKLEFQRFHRHDLELVAPTLPLKENQFRYEPDTISFPLMSQTAESCSFLKVKHPSKKTLRDTKKCEFLLSEKILFDFNYEVRYTINKGQADSLMKSEPSFDAWLLGLNEP
jgi:hypothetical protein